MPDQQDIEQLKPEDVVITSTPQQRKTEERTPPPAAPAAPVAAKPGEKESGAAVAEEEEEEEEEEGTPEGEQPAPEGEGEEEEEEEEEGDEPEDRFEELDYEALSEEVGLELDSEEDVIDSLKELAGYKSLSPALQKAIEIERGKGDVAAYFKAIASDPKDLSDRDALWEQYVAENPKRVAGNPKFARLDFDRKIEKEYSLLNEYEKLSASEQEDFLEEHKDEIDYLKEKRKVDAEAARASLQEIREKTNFYPAAEAKNAPMSEDKLKEVIRQHEAGYKKALADFDVVALDIGGEFEFNVGLGETNRAVAEGWMKNPDKFLAELGFSKDKVDYDVLAGWVTLIADIKYGTFGERFKQALLDNKDIQTLEKTLDAPGVGKLGGDAQIVQGDEWDKVGAAFEKKRLESKKKR